MLKYGTIFISTAFNGILPPETEHRWHKYLNNCHSRQHATLFQFQQQCETTKNRNLIFINSILFLCFFTFYMECIIKSQANGCSKSGTTLGLHAYFPILYFLDSASVVNTGSLLAGLRLAGWGWRKQLYYSMREKATMKYLITQGFVKH